jgi:hypothetical protein
MQDALPPKQFGNFTYERLRGVIGILMIVVTLGSSLVGSGCTVTGSGAGLSFGTFGRSR